VRPQQRSFVGALLVLRGKRSELWRSLVSSARHKDGERAKEVYEGERNLQEDNRSRRVVAERGQLVCDTPASKGCGKEGASGSLASPLPFNVAPRIQL
jgi:hypothetical protein